jgi:hypothetical protein
VTSKKSAVKTQKSDAKKDNNVADVEVTDGKVIDAENSDMSTLAAGSTSTSTAEDFYGKLAKTEIQYGRGNNKATFKGEAKYLEAIKAISEGTFKMSEFSYEQNVLQTNSMDIARLFICKLAKEAVKKPEAVPADAITALIEFVPQYWKTFAAEMAERYAKNN